MSANTQLTAAKFAGYTTIKQANKAAKRLQRRAQKGRRYANA